MSQKQGVRHRCTCSDEYCSTCLIDSMMHGVPWQAAADNTQKPCYFINQLRFQGSPTPFLLLPLHASGTQPFIWGLLKMVLRASTAAAGGKNSSSSSSSSRG
jgi:hypothetical protein